MALNLFDVHY